MKVQVAAPIVARRYDWRLRPGARQIVRNEVERAEVLKLQAACGSLRTSSTETWIAANDLSHDAEALGVELDPAATYWCLAALGHADRRPPGIVRIEIVDDLDDGPPGGDASHPTPQDGPCDPEHDE